MSNAFCGGVASSKEELCGAVSAGIMIIGDRYGRVTAEASDAASLAAAAAFRNRFIERFGATKCDDVRIPDKTCTWVVEDASRRLIDIMEEDWNERVASSAA